jgi:hypothetical protein
MEKPLYKESPAVQMIKIRMLVEEDEYFWSKLSAGFVLGLMVGLLTRLVF